MKGVKNTTAFLTLWLLMGMASKGAEPDTVYKGSLLEGWHDISFQLDGMTRNNDLITSFGIGLRQSEYRIRTMIEFGFRPYFKPVPYMEENTVHQYQERHHRIVLMVEKDFILPFSKKIYPYVSLRGGYGWEDRKSFTHNKFERVLVIPSAGVGVQLSEILSARLGYRFLDDPSLLNAPHWFGGKLLFDL